MSIPSALSSPAMPIPANNTAIPAATLGIIGCFLLSLRAKRSNLSLSLRLLRRFAPRNDTRFLWEPKCRSVDKLATPHTPQVTLDINVRVSLTMPPMPNIDAAVLAIAVSIRKLLTRIGVLDPISSVSSITLTI